MDIPYLLILFNKPTAPPNRPPAVPPTDATPAVAAADIPAAPESKDSTPYDINN